MRWLLKEKFSSLRGQKGFSLIEVLMAVVILAAVGVAFLAAMTTANKSVGILDEKTQAEALARTQLEKIKEAVYQDTEGGGWYLSERIVDLPSQYSMSINVTAPTHIGTADNYTSLEDLMGGPVTTIQEITVFVLRPTGNGDRLVFSVTAYKGKVE